MECNKDEAIRAKEIAVRKFLEKDILGAAKFALKAQKLHPELEGVSHLVANFELHMCAKLRRNGEIDWYRMLGVSPSADADTISRQYRKMALLIHPDKNREVGSESAFKLLSEAFRVLKDKTLRLAYDQRTNNQQYQQNVPSHGNFVPVHNAQTGYSAAPDWSHFKKQGFGTQSKQSAAQQQRPFVGGCSGAPPHPVNNPKPKTAKKSDRKMDSSSPNTDNEEISSFWTRCTGCKMQYEYYLMFINQHLRCPNCETTFQALRVPVPSIWQNDNKCFSLSRHQNQNSFQMDGSSVTTYSYRAGTSSGLSSITIASDIVHPSPSSALHAADIYKPSNKRLNQNCNDTDGNRNLESKRQKLADSIKSKPMVKNGNIGPEI